MAHRMYVTCRMNISPYKFDFDIYRINVVIHCVNFTTMRWIIRYLSYKLSLNIFYSSRRRREISARYYDYPTTVEPMVSSSVSYDYNNRSSSSENSDVLSRHFINREIMSIPSSHQTTHPTSHSLANSHERNIAEEQPRVLMSHDAPSNLNTTGNTNRPAAAANQCHICRKTYGRPSTLKTHVRTHLGERPYRCYLCGKSFTQPANLTAHNRIHSGEKPFKCPACSRHFSQVRTESNHRQTTLIPT